MAPSAFPLLPITSARTLRWIEAMEPGDRSVFIASYPKSGTTWLQYIVWQIVAAHRESTGGPPLDLAHISDFAPFLEADRTWEDGRVADPAASFQRAAGFACFNTHLLHHMLPPASGAGSRAKIIYVSRAPADVCTSFWHHLSHQAVADGGYASDLPAFVDDWLGGKIAFGAWRPHVGTRAHHVAPRGNHALHIPSRWQAPRTQWHAQSVASGSWLAAAASDSRVLVLTYEKLKSDLLGCVRHVADHIGCGGLSDQQLQEILPRLSADYMRANLQVFAPKSVRWVERGDGFTFVRKVRPAQFHLSTSVLMSLCDVDIFYARSCGLMVA